VSHNEERRPGGNGAANKSLTATPIVARCCACHHPLTAPRSVSRGYGPTCWARLEAAQTAERRARVVGLLDDLRGRLDALDGPALGILAAGLLDVTDALDEVSRG